ncbi:MAG: class I SAM-dependent methyltransferase, partial [Syntrophales bacterium LBB04]|nr:class I SAM-dependent methyltransferase [Syntrophales bacterium LBB04]
LVTLKLQPLVHSITGIDNSQGMLDQFKMKIARQNLTNVNIQRVDIEKRDIFKGNYHLIVSSMTFHHIKEIKPLLNQFYKIIAPEGYLCIADLDLDNGLFHDDNTGVFHPGFSREKLKDFFLEAGFNNVRDMTAAKIVKPAANEQMREFSVFLMSGQKNLMN